MHRRDQRNVRESGGDGGDDGGSGDKDGVLGDGDDGHGDAPQVLSKLAAVKGLGDESSDEEDASKWIEKQRKKVGRLVILAIFVFLISLSSCRRLTPSP